MNGAPAQERTPVEGDAEWKWAAVKKDLRGQKKEKKETGLK